MSGSLRRAAPIVAVALFPFLLLVWRFDFVCDDAYISFRYAHNLMRGEGLRFNLGDQPPVEGYSEFLWVLIVSFGMVMDVAPWVFARVLSTIAGAALVAGVAWALSEKLERREALASALFLGTLAPLAVWTSGGMGTAPFLLALWFLYRGVTKAGLVVAIVSSIAVVLLRADGAYWVACFGGAGLLLGKDSKEIRRVAFFASAAGLVAFLVHTGWRYSYYGDWMPNTARVKVGFSAYSLGRGAQYLLHFLVTFPGVLVAVLLAAWYGRGEKFLLVALGATAFYPVMVGGDFMAFGRFVLPLLPFAAFGLVSFLKAKPGVPACGAVLAMAGVNLLPAYDKHATPEALRESLHVRHNAPEFRSEYEQWFSMYANAERWKYVGLALQIYTRTDARVVTGGIGAIGFFSDRFLYDQNGLITRSVALGPASKEKRSPGHDKAVVPEYFLHKDPPPTFLKVYLHPANEPLPPHVVPRGPNKDLVRLLEPGKGFPPGVVLIGERPR